MLQRAAVLIGVDKTGGLPQLNAVQSGVERVRTWAATQPGMRAPDNSPRITVVTDVGGGKVTAQQIKDAVKRWVDDGTIEQLFIYFAGHGANVRYGEYWLLSNAPDDPKEAVNVGGSVPLGRQCGIPHVVMISDACRTAAASMQSQAVQGTIIFPNTGPAAKPGCVDSFYATALGKPALEVSDPNAASGFDAVYTTSLVDGLSGKAPPSEQRVGSNVVKRVQPWPLQDYLVDAVPELLTQRGVQLGVSQTPEAIITSRPEAWLAELPAPGTPLAPTAGSSTRGATRGARQPRSMSTPPQAATLPSRRSAAATLKSVSRDALRVALGAVTRGASRTVTRSPRGGGDATRYHEVFSSTIDQTTRGSAPKHFESECGFKVDGVGVDFVVSARGRVDMLDAPNGLVRLWDVPKPATNVLVGFSDGRGALIPAIPGFIASLTYEQDADGELTNITYEPSDNTANWTALQSELPALRQLRRVVAAATRLGVFRPDDLQDQVRLIDRLRRSKGLDPTMAVYAAYALHALAQREAIDEMQVALRLGSGLTMFDVAMLASPGRRRKARVDADVFPAAPLLSQGWALLDAFGIALPPSLEGKLYRELESSLWTLFKPKGVKLIRSAITKGEIA